MDPQEHLGAAYVAPAKTGLRYNEIKRPDNGIHPNDCKAGNLESKSYNSLVNARVETGRFSSKLKPRTLNEVLFQTETFTFKGVDPELNKLLYETLLKCKNLRDSVTALGTIKFLITKKYPEQIGTFDRFYKRLTHLLNVRLSILMDDDTIKINPMYLVSADYINTKRDHNDPSLFQNIEDVLVGLLYPVDPKYFGAGEIGVGLINPVVAINDISILEAKSTKALSELDIVGIRSLLPYCVGSITTGRSKVGIEIFTEDGLHACTLLIVNNCDVRTNLALLRQASKNKEYL